MIKERYDPTSIAWHARMGPDRWALTSVLALWAAMVSIVFACIAIYGRNVPLAEDWDMVPPLTGHEPNLVQWLWAQNNEHRLPLQKAVYLVLLKASAGDFRIGMIANTLLLGGLSLAMILTARRLRGGRTRLADVFFPLALLHLGHWENMVWGWEIQFVISTVLVCLWLLIIVRESWPLPPKIAVTAGLTLVLLPLSGANGLLFTPFVALWLAAGILRHRRDMTAGWILQFQTVCIIASIALIGLYFVGYGRPSWNPPNPGFAPTLRTGAKFIGMAFGPVGAYHGWIAALPFGVASLLLVSSVIPVGRGLRSNCSPERFRAFGFLNFAAAMMALVVAIAFGRAGWVPYFGMPDRYALFSVPALCAVYLVWILYGPEVIRDRIAITFAIATLLALPFNVLKGRSWRHWYVAGMQAFEHDLSSDLSWPELADRHNQFLMHWDRDALLERMRMLHEARIGPLGKAMPQESTPP